MKPSIRTTLAGMSLFAMMSGAVHASVTIDIIDTGADISVTASGTLNLTDLTDSIGNFLASAPGMVDFGGALLSSQGLLLGNPVGAYTLRSGPTFSGSPYPFFGAERDAQTQLPLSGATGDLLTLGFHGATARVGIGVAGTFVNGSAVSASGTFAGLELSRLGVAAGDTYGWTWGSGPTSDFLVINVAAIPEPSSYALMLAGLGLLGVVALRARR